MEKEVVGVATKNDEAEEAEVEVDLQEDKITLDVLPNTRDCVVLYESMSLNTVTRHQWII